MFEEVWCVRRLPTGQNWQKAGQEVYARNQLLGRAVEEKTTPGEIRKGFVCHKRYLLALAQSFLLHMMPILM